MHVLVTGATGYVGALLVPQLLEAGHEVRGLTRDRQSPRASRLAGSGAEVVEGGLSDRPALASALSGVDAVAHLAYDDESGDRGLFDVVEDAPDGRRPHLVYTTGCSVYGQHRHARLDATTPLDPTTVRARLEAELADRAIPATVLRPGMVFGADARTSIVGDWFAQAAAGGPVVLPGLQDKVWSWVHAADVAAAFVAVLADPQAHVGRAFLLADETPTPPRGVVDAVAMMTGTGSGAVDIADELPEYRVFDRDEVIDAADARRDLGWTPREASVLSDLPRSFEAWSRKDADPGPSTRVSGR